MGTPHLALAFYIALLLVTAASIIPFKANNKNMTWIARDKQRDSVSLASADLSCTLPNGLELLFGLVLAFPEE